MICCNVKLLEGLFQYTFLKVSVNTFRQRMMIRVHSDHFSQEVMSGALRVSPGAPEHLINAPTATEALMDVDVRTASPIGEWERKGDEGITVDRFFLLNPGQ